MPHHHHLPGLFDHPVYPVLQKDGCHFSVWAPERKSMTLHLLARGDADTGIAMQKDKYGYFTAFAEGVTAGDLYYYLPDGGKQYPDPCSQHQPNGVHGPSAVVDHSLHPWNDSPWTGRPLASMIFYEIHVGTFTAEGTLDAIIPRLDDLVSLGITAIELMPLAECPGERNWGYDGVFLFAVQHNYGGPDALRRLVDACHRRGIAVFLDVVYNHLGPEGNYLDSFGPYFSGSYNTPWGKALNFDRDWSDGVRRFVVSNVLYWARYFHLDGLRLDAVHEIYDRNAHTIWDELHKALHHWGLHSGRSFYLIAESDTNDPRTIRMPAAGGHGFHAQWLDDFHHALYVLLDREGQQHYEDYGELHQLAKAYTEGFVFSGEYVLFRRRTHGASSAGIAGEQFVVFNQNHDLPGNRPDGARLSALIDGDRLKLAAAAVLLSPYLPLLFMGEEYGDDSPFYFFSDYHDPQITANLCDQRRGQFAGFNWDTEAPDPQELSTFRDCILKWDQRHEAGHRQLLEWHRRLIALRKTHPLLTDLSRQYLRADLLGTTGLAICRHSADRRNQLLVLFNFSATALATVVPCYSRGPEAWTKLLSSTSIPEDLAPGKPIELPPWCAAVYELDDRNALPD
ncbi:MAG TPA: malto-oligosyltrehalose trehalohydrolase [Puia sp.]|jgi:maltooligosyltrehalose trehalohydrolase|nr:malto-oligosyltrehalose trehalohydrolase [Puia sp.]